MMEGRLFGEINSLTFDGCLSSWVAKSLCLSHKFLCANFFVLILEQCTSRSGPSLHQKERKFGRFSRILLFAFAFQGFCSRTRCVFRAIPTRICILLQRRAFPRKSLRKENSLDLGCRKEKNEFISSPSIFVFCTNYCL